MSDKNKVERELRDKWAAWKAALNEIDNLERDREAAIDKAEKDGVELDNIKANQMHKRLRSLQRAEVKKGDHDGFGNGQPGGGEGYDEGGGPGGCRRKNQT